MNNCLHGVNCWYRHDEPMETQFDSGQSTKPVKDFKCNVCAKTYQNSNSLKAHVKNEHSSVLLCQNFELGKCEVLMKNVGSTINSQSNQLKTPENLSSRFFGFLRKTNFPRIKQK